MDIFERLHYLGKHLDEEEKVVEFDSTLASFSGNHDPQILEGLLSVFDDECPDYGVMYGLVHLVETWPDHIYFSILIKNLNIYIEKAPDWFMVLLYRILNHKKSLDIFRSYMHLASRKTLLKIFDKIQKDSSHHKKLIAQLRSELENEIK
jgi:hypothetical protein